MAGGIMKDGQPYFFGSGEVYSTEEQVIGTWIDGKPIYRKTISCGALPNAARKNVEHGISDIDKFIMCYGISNDTSGLSLAIPNVHASDVSYNITVSTDKTKITLTTGTNRSSLISYVTLEYTKTTD